MPFNFHQVYQVDDITRAYLAGPTLALGVRVLKRTRPSDLKTETAVEFLHSSEVHQIFGEPQKLGGGVVRVNDTFLRGVGGIHPVWQFTPLTLEAWRALGAKGLVSGYDYLKTVFYDDASLQNFYLNEWLYDGWEPEPKD